MLSHFKLPFTPDWHCSNARAVPARRPQRYGDLDQQAEAMGGLRQLFPVNATDVTPCNTSRLTYIPLQLLISPAKRWTSFTWTFYTSTSFVHEWYYRGGGRKVLFALTFMNGIISVRFLLDLDLDLDLVSDCVNEWNQKQQKSSN